MSIELYTSQENETSEQIRSVTETKVSEDRTQNESEQIELASVRASEKDVCAVSRQLATLLRAGMPLVPALSVMVEQLQSANNDKIKGLNLRQNRLAEVMKKVAEDVSSGSTLACAVNKYPKVFSSLFVNMTAAGETAGTLEDALTQLTGILEKKVNLAAKIRSAIAYPVMMMITAVCVVTFLLSFVVPNLTEIFLEMNKTLPMPTRLLIAVSGFMRSYLWAIIAAVCAAGFGLRFWTKTDEGRLYIDRLKIKMPLFGNIFLKLETAKMTRTLAALLKSGVPVLYALEIVTGVIRNSFVANKLKNVKDDVSKGQTVAGSIRNTGLFAPVIFHILSTSQAGGDIESGLTEIADMYEEEIDRLTKTALSLLEPAILLVMGVVVGFIVTAILLPIFEINTAF